MRAGVTPLLALAVACAGCGKFPELTNLDGAVMQLSREICPGVCMAYNLEIHGDGATVFRSLRHTVVAGEHHEQLTKAQVQQVVEAFRKADYFSLKNRYVAGVIGTGPTITSFAVGRRKKTVVDLGGLDVGMPQAVRDLEETIDRVAGTKKWTEGNAETVPALKTEGFDFQSQAADQILANAAERWNLALVEEMVREGAGKSLGNNTSEVELVAAARTDGFPNALYRLLREGVGKGDKELLNRALLEAAQAGNKDSVDFLLRYGADAHAEGRAKDGGPVTVLMAALQSGNRDVIEDILQSHPDVNVVDDRGRAALWYACDPEKKHPWDESWEQTELIRALLQAGARVNAQDQQGDAAFHRPVRVWIAKALLDGGADVNLRNGHGDTPLMKNLAVDVARLLVEAGADVNAKNKDGKTALDLARLSGANETVRYLESVQAFGGPKAATSR